MKRSSVLTVLTMSGMKDIVFLMGIIGTDMITVVFGSYLLNIIVQRRLRLVVVDESGDLDAGGLGAVEEIAFKDVPLESPRIHLVTGRPGQGKTVLDFSIADRLYRETGKPVYVAMTERDREIEGYEGMPEYIHTLRGINFPLDSIVIGDDWQRIIHARRGMADINILIDKMFATHRHDNIDFLIDSQTASSIDRNNILRSNYRWYKAPLKKELTLGRQELEPELVLADSMNLDLDEALLDYDEGAYKVTGIPLPKYWSDELSVLHRRQPLKLHEKLVKLL